MPGFWLLDEEGRETHVNGDPDMSHEMLAELLVMFEAAYRAVSDTLRGTREEEEENDDG